MESALEKPLAWQGWTLRVPASWDLVMETGSVRRGALRLANEQAVVLELSWGPAGPRHPVPDWGRSGPGTRTTCGSLVVARPVPWLAHCGAPLLDHRLLRSAPEVETVEALVHSHEQARIAVLRCHQAPGLAPDHDLVARVLSSLRAPAPGRPWPVRVFGIHLAVPGTWPLLDRQLAVGLTRFVFGTPQGRLHVCAWGLARQRPPAPGPWLAAFLRTRYPQLQCKTEPDPAATDDAWTIRGTTRPGVWFSPRLRAGLRRHWTGRLCRRLDDNTDYILLWAHRAGVRRWPWEAIAAGAAVVDTIDLCGSP